MDNGIALIGFGEAASAFASDAPAWRGDVRAFDLKTEAAATRAAKLGEMAHAGVAPAASSAEALGGAGAALSLVTADQALEAARVACRAIGTGALWLDMNSVAPGTKREAAAAIHAAGGRYVDVAVMAPVFPKRRAVPVLMSGPHAEAGAETLGALGFSAVRIVHGAIGAASAIKMIRSVMVKGIEALTAECVLAGDAAGVLDEVIASLDSSWPGADWRARADYNLDRMMAHGLRRAAEMREVARTLRDLGIVSRMSDAAGDWQQAVGAIGIAPPTGLAAKLDALRACIRSEAA